MTQSSWFLVWLVTVTAILADVSHGYVNLQQRQRRHQQYYTGSGSGSGSSSSRRSSLWDFGGANKNKGKQDDVQKLQKEKLELQHDFETYKTNQQKQQEEWERQVQELTRTVQQLQKEQKGGDKEQHSKDKSHSTMTPDVGPGVVSLTKTSTSSPTSSLSSSSTIVTHDDKRREQIKELREQEWAHQVEELQRQIAQLQHALDEKTQLLAEMPPDVITLQETYTKKLQALQHKHEAEAKLAEERLMQLQIHNQKFQQGIKDQAAGKQERLKIDYDAKLDRKNNELSKAKVALVQAQERVASLQSTLMEMRHDQQSLRRLTRTGLDLIKTRLKRRLHRFQENRKKNKARSAMDDDDDDQ